MYKIEEAARDAARRFELEINSYTIEHYGCGHINDTFLLECQGRRPRYILQRINGHVFKSPEEVMANIIGVTSFCREKVIERGGDPLREVLTLIPTVDGQKFLLDAHGDYWRTYLFVEDTVSYQLPETPELFGESAAAFGNFASLLREYPSETLFETIPRFHDTPHRFEQLREAISADASNRLCGISAELDFVLEREGEAGTLINLQKNGDLPTRVTHNDTKLNNVLLDAKSGRGVCVIDLDTVMPGLTANDFGDSIRFGANSAGEDEVDRDRIHISLPMFEAYAESYLHACNGALSPLEIEMLPLGSKLMTLECGIRFLTDYLAGDVYFKIEHAGQNLERARNQFKLVASMEDHWDEMTKIVSVLIDQ